MRIFAEGDTYVASIRITEKDALKRAGWQWSITRKRWETKAHAKAEPFSPFMEESAKALQDRWNRTSNAAFKMSMAAEIDQDFPAPEGLTYLGYQKVGIAYSLSRQTTLIADPPGLGKTIQAIGVGNAVRTPKRVCIICPASLKVNWKREWDKWSTLKLSSGIAGTVQRSEKGADGKRKTVTQNFWPDTQVVIVNYDILDRFAEKLRAVTWDLLIIDEGHYLGNRQTKRSRNVFGELKKVKGKWKWLIQPLPFRKRLILTGTPMLGKPEDMFNLIRQCDPHGLGRDWIEFAYRYCGAYEGAFGLVTSGASNLGELQRTMRERFMLRREKREVLKELPDKRRELIMLPQDGLVKLVDRENSAYSAFREHMIRYEAMLRGEDPDAVLEAMQAPQIDIDDLSTILESRFGKFREMDFDDIAKELGAAEALAFEELATARRELAIAKIPMIVQQAKNIVNSGEKLILFGVHKAVCRALRDHFPGCAYVTGEVPSHKRQAQIDMFQEDPDCMVAVGNITAMGVGYTMTAAANVDFAELHWVPTDMEQAEDRAWRIGQKNFVLARHFAVEGTMDSRMVEVFLKKMEIIGQALDASTLD